MSPALQVLLAVNLMAFVLMGVDKFRAARGAWRISELTLFLFPLFGGALGGVVGMMLFQHKTRKWYFAYGLPLLCLVQLLALGYLKTKGI